MFCIRDSCSGSVIEKLTLDTTVRNKHRSPARIQLQTRDWITRPVYSHRASLDQLVDHNLPHGCKVVSCLA